MLPTYLLIQEMRTFAAYLVGVGLSPKTVAIYVKCVTKAILWFVECGGDLLTATAPDLARWAGTLPASLSARR